MTPPSHSSVCYSSQPPCTYVCYSAITLQQVAIILWSTIIMMAAYFNRLYKALSVDNAHNYTDPSYIPLRMVCRASLSLLEFLEEYIKGEI